MTDSLWEKIQETAGPRASQEALQGNRDEKGFAVSLVYLWKSVPCAFNYLLIFFFKCSIKSTAAGCCVSWDTEESEPEPGGGQGSDPGAGAGCGCQAFMACSRRSACGMFSTKPLEGSGRPGLSLKPGVFASQTGRSPKKRQLRLYIKRSP